SPGVEPAGFGRSDFTAFLSWSAGEQLSLLGTATDPRNLSAHLHPNLYPRGRNLKDKPGLILIVDVFRFDLQFFLAGFANPVMLAFDKRVVVDPLAVIFRAQIALHTGLF